MGCGTCNCCLELDKRLFPVDFTAVNAWGGCCLTPPRYSLYRALFLFLTIVDFAYVAFFYKATDLLFFTSWGSVLTLICSLTLCVENLLNWCLQYKTSVKYWKVSHFIFTLTLVLEVMINLIYWGALFPLGIFQLWGEFHIFDILNPIMAHAVPLLLLMIDFQLNLVVVWNFMFLPFEFVVLLCYLVVNSVYTTQKSPIYSLINYKSYLTYLFLLACGVTLALSHLACRMFCRFLKEQRVKAMFDNQDNSNPDSTIPVLNTVNSGKQFMRGYNPGTIHVQMANLVTPVAVSSAITSGTTPFPFTRPSLPPNSIF